MNKKSLHIFFFSLLLLMNFSGSTQNLSISISSTPNKICNGQDCDYNGPSIMINEVMMMPDTFDSSIAGCPPIFDTNFYCEGEWIELYNPHHCDPVDISCFFLGNAARDNNYGAQGSTIFSAGFIIPEGTIIPPRGFALVRGRKAPPVPAHLLVENGGNTVEIVVEDPNLLCIEGSRLWFPNAGGWFAFYDNNGVPQDAISWHYDGNADSNACNPGPVNNCSYSGELDRYSKIPNNRKTSVADVPAIEGKTFRRIPDGGEWVKNMGAEPTYATCNATCILPNVLCDGQARANVIGGVQPYEYFWNDWQSQRTQTATGLCPGIYCVTVIDANSDTIKDCMEIKNIELLLELDSVSELYCEGDTITIKTEVSMGQFPYQYEWEGPNGIYSTDSILHIISVSDTYSGEYQVQVYDKNQCMATDSLQLNISFVPELEIHQTGPYCEGDTVLIWLSDISSLSEINWTGPNGFEKEGNFVIIPDALTGSSGEYSVDAITQEGCKAETASTKVRVSEIPFINLADIINACVEVVLEIEETDMKFLWNTGDTTNNITITSTGNYWVIVDNNGCINRDSTMVNILPVPNPDFSWTPIYPTMRTPRIQLINHTKPEEEAYFYLWKIQKDKNNFLAFDSISDTVNPYYQWSASGNDLLQGVYEIELQVFVKDIFTGNMLENCRDSITYKVRLLNDFLQFPNVITPNGDGINDVFQIINLIDGMAFPENELIIYDRAGRKVYRKKNIQIEKDYWDPKGTNSPPGTYFYQFIGKGFDDVEYKGAVEVIVK